LFFDFIDLAKKLQPKVVIAENVKGLLLGEAKQYVRQIYSEFDLAGYYCQHWLLDASKMGVPQRRERVFFIALRKDLAEPFMKQVDLFTVAPELILEFNEPEIFYGEFADKLGKPLTDHQQMLWEKKIDTDTNLGDINQRERGLLSDFNAILVKHNSSLNTITANGKFIDFETPQHISDEAIKQGGSYPLDYDFKGNKVVYLVGMSVPPIMTAQISTQIYSQWLSKL
jgi:DNA (cytosine-5)-methyltransferase 1